MRMTRFRVLNYKKITDSGWVKTGNMTAFVGKNEAGKSALFRGLSKLNPSDGAKYDVLREFPRRRYATEGEKWDWDVSSATFRLSDDEVEDLAAISPVFEETREAEVTRYYSGDYAVEYNPPVKKSSIPVSEFSAQIDQWIKTVEKLRTTEERGEALKSLKAELTQVFKNASATLQSARAVESDFVRELIGEVNANINDTWQEKLLKKPIDELTSIDENLRTNALIQQADSLIIGKLPSFVYFDRYDILDSAIHIDDFIQQIRARPNAPRIRVTRCLFEHVGIDIDEISKLDPTREEHRDEILQRVSDKRQILLSSGAAAITNEFAEWWDQRKHKFRYTVDGTQFRVWVSDDLDPSEVELDQRSAGMQYFFSFFLIFLTESKKKHANSILLLDEPGLQFHGTAQQKVVKFLRNLSKKNQLLYTTHSAFMIDADHLEDVKIVTEDEGDFGSTKVSDDLWPDDKDALFPLQAGLGYTMAQTLFFSKRQLVVEGITDYFYLKAAGNFLKSQSRTSLAETITITPVGGAKNIARMASLLLANDVKLATLLDGDDAGLAARNKLQQTLLDVAIMDDFAMKPKATIEDMFNEEFYLDAAKVAYPDVDFGFASKDKTLSITQRITAEFERSQRKYNKYLVCQVIVGWINDQNSPHVLSEEVCAKFEKLFVKINSMIDHDLDTDVS